MEHKDFGSERQSSSQTTSFSTPYREHTVSKTRNIDTPTLSESNTPAVGELKDTVTLI